MMLKSMTGFGGKEKEIVPFGKVHLELKSSNHKFLDIVFHLPEGFLSLENRIKKEIEARLKRGRVVCALNIIGGKSEAVSINKRLLNIYVRALENIKEQFRVKDEVSLNTLINLPGVLSLAGDRIPEGQIWPSLKGLVNRTLDDLVVAREKEGRALHAYLKTTAAGLKGNLGAIQKRFKKIVAEKVAKIVNAEERANFLKETDISEEIERLSFHIRNFMQKLEAHEPVGKELDFIAQEMQREANTIAAKSFDAHISARTIQIKSRIEKLREQVQNIE